MAPLGCLASPAHASQICISYISLPGGLSTGLDASLPTYWDGGVVRFEWTAGDHKRAAVSLLSLYSLGMVCAGRFMVHVQ